MDHYFGDNGDASNSPNLPQPPFPNLVVQIFGPLPPGVVVNAPMMIADEPVQLQAPQHVPIPPAVLNPYVFGPLQVPPPPVQNPEVNAEHAMETRNGVHHESFHTHSQIPVYIVEDHHQVIPFVHENIRKKFLPIEGLSLIHFDSHPDMLIPKDMPAEDAFEPSKLYLAHSIENWIMPNCYNGIFQQLIWVRPPWANQIRDEMQKIQIGKCKETGKIRLECRENYFISEGLFKFREELDNVKEVNLEILTLGNRLIHSADDIGRMMHISENNDKIATVLDIDLDFFSTKNPFLGLYEEINLYDRLRILFKFTPPLSIDDADIAAAQAARNQQLDELKELFDHLKNFKVMPEFEGAEPTPNFKQVNAIFDLLAQSVNIDEVDWETIFIAGCTIDDHELPHHVSAPEDLEIMFQSFKNFIDTFLDYPRIITISRSSDDDYCPREDVEDIQKRVLDILNHKFPCGEPVLQYLQHAQGEQPQPIPMADVDEDSTDPDSTSSLSSNTQSSSDSSISRSNSAALVPALPLDEAGPSDL